MTIKKWVLTGCIAAALLCAGTAQGQEKRPIKEADYTDSTVPMADKFRQEGKIYVLTGIIMIILLGTLAYLVVIDRKISKIEKDKN